MSLKFKMDLKGIRKDLDRLEGAPSIEGVLALEAALDGLFIETQERVHVITGSLRASGKTDTNLRRHVWTGEITYGGKSEGFPNNPVKYATYEQARDGAHDFMLGADLVFVDEVFTDAVEIGMGNKRA